MKIINEKKNKGVELPGTNLLMTGFGHDTSGNYVVRLKFFNAPGGFSIQTGGTLRKTERIGKNAVGDGGMIDDGDLEKIAEEVVKYIQEHGSDEQKKRLKAAKWSATAAEGIKVQSLTEALTSKR